MGAKRTEPNICKHPERKHGAKGLCASCYTMAWAREHPGANAGNAWLKAHPERAAELSRRAALRKHGMTPASYDALWNKQGGKCANRLCNKSAPLVMKDYRASLHVDHCHATGVVRGLLCQGCNLALGHTADSRDRLLGLIEYLGRGIN
jgi:hypothetical protein